MGSLGSPRLICLASPRPVRDPASETPRCMASEKGYLRWTSGLHVHPHTCADTNRKRRAGRWFGRKRRWDGVKESISLEHRLKVTQCSTHWDSLEFTQGGEHI